MSRFMRCEMQLHTFPPPPPSFYKLSTSGLSVSQCDNGVFPPPFLNWDGNPEKPFQTHYQLRRTRMPASSSLTTQQLGGGVSEH
ncbi:Dynein assembly factor 3, axonemal [Clarias magur]|uniref:Dynein assembly factor 3, axonemal n=1 Tax=Clarias magur TaxID=1594786 RepID=A0A8J4XHY5_CLAMG|nr:Dynein assembly factor 3, axonemal [Clarias magur]